MSFRLVPKSVTLNGVMAVTLRYFIEFGKPALQETICGGIYASVIVFLVRVQCRSRESSRSLSHLLMSFWLKQVHVNACSGAISLPAI